MVAYLSEGYTAAFDTGDEAYPHRLLSGGWFQFRSDAVMACIADMRKRAMAGDAAYCDLDSYVITHEKWTEESLHGPIELESWRANEVAGDIVDDAPNYGDQIWFWKNGRRLRGQITHVATSFSRGYYVVTEFNRNDTLSRNSRRQHFFHKWSLGYDRFPKSGGVRNADVYRRFVVGKLGEEPYHYEDVELPKD